MDCESKMENPGSPDRDAGAEGGAEGMADCEGLKGGAEETDDCKKRKRKPYRPGKLSRMSQNVFCFCVYTDISSKYEHMLYL